MISFAITACNEHEELKTLLDFLIKNKQENDEIVVVTDYGNTTDEVLDLMFTYDSKTKWYSHELNKDFASHKNYLFSKCTKDYIFNLDADEMISDLLIRNIHSVLLNNPTVDLFVFPRWNIVNGITDEYIKQMGWNKDPLERINWPDYQMRLVKNFNGIRWVGKVHEKLSGYSKYVYIPQDASWAINHFKQFQKQISQNNFYSQF